MILSKSTYLIFLVLVIVLELTTPMSPLFYSIYALWACIALYAAPDMWRKDKRYVYAILHAKDGWGQDGVPVGYIISDQPYQFFGNGTVYSHQLSQEETKMYMRGLI